MPAIHDGDIDELDNCDEFSNMSEQIAAPYHNNSALRVRRPRIIINQDDSGSNPS